MPHHHDKITVSGKITHLFGHRFVVKTAKGHVLADLTPHGEDQIALRVDDVVTLEGEMKPTELKVSRLIRGRKTVEIEHKKKHHDHHHHDHHHYDHHEHADPAVAITAAKAAGFKVLGSPRRKPKHFEVLAQQRGKFSELHIELDGHIRKSKPVDKTDDKWASDLPGKR